MIARALFWAALVSVFPMTRHAVDAQGTYTVLGAGGDSCGRWLELRRSTDPANGLRSTIEVEWVEGYISAYNLYVWNFTDVGAGTDVDALKAWIDSYCQANPLERVHGAAQELIKTLRQRQH